MRIIDGDALDKFLDAAEKEATKNRKYVLASAINTIRGNIRNFPSAQPERKTGKWVGVKEYCDHIAEREGKGHRFIPSGMNNCVYCNQCWESNDRRTTYCPNCGANMRGEEDEIN